MRKLNEKSKIKVEWTTSVYDYTKENEKKIISSFSKKYGVPKENVTVHTKFVNPKTGEDETVSANEAITNINDTEFQRKLFRDFASEKGIECDFDAIFEIDSKINSLMDYDKYEKKATYSFEWIRWSNFLSYGEDNYINFNDIKGLVLLSSDPANQGGKTNFAVDLPHFIQYGVTGKTDVQADIFNRYRPECTDVTVECCIKKDGAYYVIRRTLSRPALAKRTAKSKVTSKVQYFRLEGDNYIELKDCDSDGAVSEGGATAKDTNRVIKEAFGREEDFDMIVCATEDNLKDLLEKKDTERGRILSRWIGLLPLEEKDALARDTYNKTVKNELYNNRYSEDDIKSENESIAARVESIEADIDDKKRLNSEAQKEVETLEEMLSTYREAKRSVDANVAKMDIETIKITMEDATRKGLSLKAQVEECDKEISEIGEVAFSSQEYDAIVTRLSDAKAASASWNVKVSSLRKEAKTIRESEFCPTCKRRYDGVDNSAIIKAKEDEAEKCERELVESNREIETLKAKIESMKAERDKNDRLNRLVTKKSAMEVDMERLRGVIIDCRSKIKEYEKNSEAIKANADLDIKIGNCEITVKARREEIRMNDIAIARDESEIKTCRDKASSNEKILEKISRDRKTERDWQCYLEMVGKNGVSKMVLRKVIPVINASLGQMLDGVCDFCVEMVMNEKGEVKFEIIHDETRANVMSGSGFEKFATAMALRTVLGSMSTLPRLNFIVLDEVLGAVAKTNYENVKNLLDKMLTKFDTIIQVTHNEDIKDWFQKRITVIKKGNVSRIEVCEC